MKKSLALGPLLPSDAIFLAMEAENREDLFREVAERLETKLVATESDQLTQLLLSREELGSTGLGFSMAIPHCKRPGLAEPVLAIGVSRKVLDFGDTPDGQGVRLFLFIVSPEGAPALHLQVLAAVSRWAQIPSNIERVLHRLKTCRKSSRLSKSPCRESRPWTQGKFLNYEIRTLAKSPNVRVRTRIIGE